MKQPALRDFVIIKWIFSLCIVVYSSPIIAINAEGAQAHLQKAMTYYKSGDYASAKLEFETVLRLDELPPDLHLQTEIYAAIAEEYIQGKRFLPSGYLISGLGNYRENTTSAGIGETNDDFFNARAGGRLNYVISNDVTLNNSLDYRYRKYSDNDRRVDSDLRWNSSVSRNLDENNLDSGVRGRISYRGDGNYRNDYGLYSSYRMLVNKKNQITLSGELRRRNYPQGHLPELSRNIAELIGNWNHSMLGGKASFSLDVFGGWENATNNRPDGHSNFYGLLPKFNVTFNDQLGGFVSVRWQNDRYNSERYTFDSDERIAVATRNDDLYELSGGLTWEFRRGWSLIPEVLYIHDKSNILVKNYSSTEIWLNLRCDFD